MGARITREGLAFAAVASLAATPAQLGLLEALVRGPAIVVGLAGGGFVDRRPKRPILIGADLGRALVLATLPAAALLHRLAMGQIYLVAATVGALGVLFDIADHAYLPRLIGRARLVDGNAKLAATEGLAEIGGPALYGVLFQLLTAPLAIAVNAATYLFSAAALATIRTREERPAPEARARTHPVADVRAGQAVVLANPSLATLLAVVTAQALFGAIFSALYVFYALRVLHLGAAMLGATVAVGGVAAMAGAAAAGPLIHRVGIGPAFVGCALAAGVGGVFIPLAHGAPIVGMALLMAAQLIGDSFGTVAEIAGRSLRQGLTPTALLGRVGGVFAVAPATAAIAGALAGGWLGGAIGPRAALYVAVAGVVLAVAIGLVSPLARMRVMTPPADTED